MSSVKKTSKKPTAEQAGSLIYCGPNLPNGLLNQFTVYRGGLPKHLEQKFEDCPAAKQLFVPVESLSETLQAINTAGSAESVWYNEVKKHFYGGVK
ncbi:hypothetical protein [Brevibacillus sp. H7]|uniref:hypothetical protein n=1 Tax=Brevibacillus sp. H7 TaxID=3349138 RepID=UPI00380D81A9